VFLFAMDIFAIGTTSFALFLPESLLYDFAVYGCYPSYLSTLLCSVSSIFLDGTESNEDV
jgi:hypothetical protein